ncbi:transcription termination/antitermination protein NusA [Corynebacterium xerosis]|uniref:Transcription termination/antitermination protein NusA n=1 Tax=Corynebacterium xerosis TaxID=1725 RepID=A0A6B8TQ25_9CORY|nr:transcription termination factor NusA [Corynebacterium xerosis]QGS35392.1 transcription termination/antitermination protein NusA [Corynebacterium xerosis]
MKIELAALRTLEKERGIPFGEMIGLLGRALREAYRGTDSPAKYARVDIDYDSGEVTVFAQERDEEGNLVAEWDDTPEDFGRIAAHPVRQTILQRLRDAESDKVMGEYADLENQVISGVVQRDVRANEKGIIVVHIGSEAHGRDGILLPAEQLPGETLEHGDRAKCYVVGVNKTPRGVAINLSRTHPELVRKLFELEVPEVADGAVELVSIAREAGHRSKVAVHPTVKGLNAKGACIGPRGQRVSAIMNELGGEKIDIIDYDEDPAKFVGNALAPAKVISVEVLDAEERQARVVVPDYQLSLAIGREGQNARLAARLTGWRIDIHSDAEIAEAEAGAPGAEAGTVE